MHRHVQPKVSQNREHNVPSSSVRPAARLPVRTASQLALKSSTWGNVRNAAFRRYADVDLCVDEAVLWARDEDKTLNLEKVSKF